MYYRYEEQKRLFWRKRVVAEAVDDRHYNYLNGLCLRPVGKRSIIYQVPGSRVEVVHYVDRHGRPWEWVSER